MGVGVGCSVGRWAIVLALAVFLLPTATSSYHDREREITLFLTWNANAGAALSFSNDAPTEAQTRFDNPPDGAQRRQKWTDKTNRDPDPELPEPLRIWSEPVPNTLYLNTSRQIVANLSYARCGVADWELWIDGKTFLTGGLHPHNHVSTNHPSGCSSPALRKPVAPEVDVIPKGSRIELRLHLYDTPAPQFRTVKDVFPASGTFYSQRTTFRIPLFTPDEIVRRQPDLDWATPEEIEAAGRPSNDRGAAPGSPGLFAVAGLAAFGLSGRKGRPAAVAIVASSVLLAGCMGSPGSSAGKLTDATGGSANVRQIDAYESGLAGGLLGVVYDEFELPVSNVRVSVLTSGNTTFTNSRGEFQVLGLPTGTHDVAFSKKGYLTFRANAVVRPDAVTVMEVTLLPPGALGPDFRAHKHELWRGQTEITLVDAPLSVKTGECKGMTVGSPFLWPLMCQLPTLPLPAKRPDGEYLIVLPGTYRLEITLRWENKDGQNIDRLGLIVKSPADVAPHWTTAHNLTHADRTYYPRESGKPFRIDTTWEMNDNGHARETSWWFTPYAPTNTPDTQQSWNKPIHVTIKAFKGKLPIERPHVDHWRGRDVINVLDYDKSTTTWSPVRPIPADTTWIEALLEQNWETSQKYILQYRTSPKDTLKPLPLVDRQELSSRYRLALCPDDPDEVYQSTSDWLFQRAVDTDATPPTGAQEDAAWGAESELVGYGAPQFAVTVWAHRTSDGPQRECP